MSADLSSVLLSYKFFREEFSSQLKTLERHNSLLDARIREIRDNGFQFLSKKALQTEAEIYRSQARQSQASLLPYKLPENIKNKKQAQPIESKSQEGTGEGVVQEEAVEDETQEIEAEKGVYELLKLDFENNLQQFNSKIVELETLIAKTHSIVSEQAPLGPKEKVNPKEIKENKDSNIGKELKKEEKSKTKPGSKDKIEDKKTKKNDGEVEKAEKEVFDEWVDIGEEFEKERVLAALGMSINGEKIF